MKNEIKDVDIIKENLKEKGFISKKLKKAVEKMNLMTDTITSKVFDTNLITALREDLHKLIEQNNEIVKGECFLFQTLDIIRKQLNEIKGINIQIPDYIKKHFEL